MSLWVSVCSFLLVARVITIFICLVPLGLGTVINLGRSFGQLAQFGILIDRVPHIENTAFVLRTKANM